MINKKDIEQRIREQTEDLVCELGNASNLGIRFDDDGQMRHLMPIPTGRRYVPPGPYPESFYRAQKWFRRHRTELQKAIIEDFDYGSKASRYGRGHEVELVRDLARIIAPICNEHSPVDPLLVAVVLLRLGIDEFCRGYQAKDEWGAWSLEQVLGIDPLEANQAAQEGGELLWQGKWEAAIPFYEKALSKYAFHMRAMNDMAYIYATYFPSQRKGLEYAQRVFSYSLKGDPDEGYVLDTAGWASYRYNHNLETAEELLRESLSLIAPGENGHISVVYHLMCVLKDAGKTDEVKGLWQTIDATQAVNPLDQESHKCARALIVQ